MSQNSDPADQPRQGQTGASEPEAKAAAPGGQAASRPSAQPGQGAAQQPQGNASEGRPFTGRAMQPGQAGQPARPARLAAQPQNSGPFQARPMRQQVPAAPAKAAVPARAVNQQVATRPAAPPPAPPPPAQPVRKPVHVAQPRRRHWLLLVTFILGVILPTLVSAWYLWSRATDQYVSTVGFSVRQEDAKPSIDLLGGLAALGGGATGGASDTDILYQYIRSTDMVESINERLDLRTMFARQWPRDFVFAYDPEGTIEDLTSYWQRQVKIHYDSSTGLITLYVSAFAPQDAQQIAQGILEQSTSKINELSSIAREDATRLAREELEKSRVELTSARQAMTAYRMRTQIVDPQADLAGQMGVLQGLQAQLAEQMVQHDLLVDNNVRASDNRAIQSQKRIEALENLIARERAKFGQEGHGPGGESYAELVAEYEKLAVDQQFAEAAYQGARIAFESSMVEAQRQSRYIAPHITPRVAQASTEPQRLRLLLLTAGLLLVGWSIFTLVYYSVRDRG